MISFNLVQLVFIQYIGPNSYKLIDTNYTSSDSQIALKTVESLAIMDDIWLHKINNIIINQYGNLLGTHPSILTIAQHPPYYRIIYQNGEKSYAFFVQYDYLQDRILQGNITIQQQAQSTSTQQTTSSGQQKQPETQSTTRTTQSNTQNGGTRTTTATTTTSQTSHSGSSSSQSSGSSQMSGSSSQNAGISQSSGSSSQSSGSLTQVRPSSQTSSSISVQSLTRSTDYTSLVNLQQNSEISSLLSYLKTLQVSLQLPNILQAEVRQEGPFMFYRLTYRIDPIPGLT